MDRWACVSVAALPLQLLVRNTHGLRELPVVVVSEDKPQGKVMWANALALRAGILPGQSYAVALSLLPGLRAGVISPSEVGAATEEIKSALWGFSPRLEVGEEAGVFWLDASGLGRLYTSLSDWALALRVRLLDLGFAASVVVGFSRFGSYALARAGRDQRVFDDAEEERQALARVPLACLDIEPEFRDVLHKLGVRTIAALLELPVHGVLTRFGKAAQELHALARGAEHERLEPSPWVAPLAKRAILDDAERDTTRLLFVIKRLLDAVLLELARRGQALAGLTLSCKLDRKQGVFGPECLRPAVPTLDVVQLMDLVRLRIETWTLASGVVELELDASGAEASSEQLRVFTEQPRRDLAAGDRALSRLRAELGDQAVVRAVPCEGQLPEACFSWQPLQSLRLPSPPAPRVLAEDAYPLAEGAGSDADGGKAGGALKPLVKLDAADSLRRRPLVRRIFLKPELLDAPSRQLRDDGWLIRGAEHGAVTHAAGPFVVSGGWWVRDVHREYSYVLTKRGELLWVYRDKRRRRLYLHGEFA